MHLSHCISNIRRQTRRRPGVNQSDVISSHLCRHLHGAYSVFNVISDKADISERCLERLSVYDALAYRWSFHNFVFQVSTYLP